MDTSWPNWKEIRDDYFKLMFVFQRWSTKTVILAALAILSPSQEESTLILLLKGEYMTSHHLLVPSLWASLDLGRELWLPHVLPVHLCSTIVEDFNLLRADIARNMPVETTWSHILKRFRDDTEMATKKEDQKKSISCDNVAAMQASYNSAGILSAPLTKFTMTRDWSISSLHEQKAKTKVQRLEEIKAGL